MNLVVVDGGENVAACGAIQLRGDSRPHAAAKKGIHNGL